MNKEKWRKYQNGFNLDLWMTLLVEESSRAFYPKPLKCMKPVKKKKHDN